MPSVIRFQLHVVLGHVTQVIEFALAQRPFFYRRVSQIQVSRFENLTGRHQRTRADDNAIFDDRIVGYYRTHADQALVADAATVQQGFVSDGHLVSDLQFGAIGAVVATMSDVQDAAVLNVGLVADSNDIDVAANHDQRPYRAVIADDDVADNDSGIVDISAFANRRRSIAVTANHCFALQEETRIVTIFSRRALILLNSDRWTIPGLPPALAAKLALYAQLIRFDKPIGTYLLLWPTLWALAIAGQGAPDRWVLFVFVFGVFLMRSAGCAINDYADRDIDLKVARTRERPLTTGRISEREALAVFAGFALAAFLLVLTLNRFTVLLSLVGIVLAATYPYMKRFHYLPQVHLGAAFGWAVPMAFAAQSEALPKEAWLLYVAAVLWAVVYDTMYSMVDREDDLKIGIKSSAILFGDYDRIMIAVFQGLFLLALILVGRDLEFAFPYYLGLALAALLMAWEQFMIADRVPAHCFIAFLHNHWVGAAVFAGIMGHYYSV